MSGGLGRISYVVIDSVDPDALAPFWAAVLGVDVQDRIEGGAYVLLSRPAEGSPGLAFQRVPEAKEGKVRIHVDLGVDDLAGATERIQELGGSWVEAGVTHQIEGYHWRCMADPEGHEFDIASNAAP